MNNIKFWMVMVVATILSACTNQDLDNLFENTTEENTATVEFYTTEINSRTAFGEANNDGSYPTLWQEGDRVAAWVNSKPRKVGTATPSDNKKSATVVVENLVDDESGEYTIHAVSPWPAGCEEKGVNGLKYWNSSNGHSARVVIPHIQNPSATSCDPLAQIIAAQTATVQANSLAEAFATPMELTFRHLTAYGCLTLKNLPEKALKAVVLISDQPISGSINYKFPAGEAPTFTTRDDSKQTITINTTSAENVWFGIYPTDLSGKTLIVGAVMADDTYYAKTITFNTGGNFQAGRIAKFSVNFSGVETNSALSVYKESGVAKGIRYSTTLDAANTDKIISLTRTDANYWMTDSAGTTGKNVATGATQHGTETKLNGTKNWATLTKWLATDNNASTYKLPIYDFCKSLGDGWYWPNAWDLLYFSREAYKPYAAQIEVMLAYNGGDLINTHSTNATGDRYWASREIESDPTKAYYVQMDATEKETKNDKGASKSANKYFGRGVKIVNLEEVEESIVIDNLPEAQANAIAYAEAISSNGAYYPFETTYYSNTHKYSYTDNTRILAYVKDYDYEGRITTAGGYKAVTNQYGSYTGGPTFAATGRFRTEKDASGRWWIVDPEGYPHYMRGVCSFRKGTLDSNTTAFASRFNGSDEAWTIATRYELANIGFHSTGAFSTDGYATQNAYNTKYSLDPFPLAPSFGFLSQFRQKKKIDYPGGDKSQYAIGLVLYEEEWPAFCLEYMQSAAFAPYLNNKFVVGFFSDNEIDFTSNSNGLVLERFLNINDENDIAYKAAEAFMTQKGASKVTDALNSEFAGILAEKYYKGVRDAVNTVDPELLYLGSRLHGTPKYLTHVVDAAEEYCDIISINYYSKWSPEADKMANWGGNKAPFFITEFYTQSVEFNDSEYEGSGEWVGEGFHVQTEKERGYAYQHFTLGLLEAKNCVGWYWFKYQDDGNKGYKGLYDNNYQLFPNLSKLMAEVNLNVYNIIEFFDN